MKERLAQYHHEVMTRSNNTPKVIPAHRKAFKAGYSFGHENFATQREIWNYIWKASDNWWVRIHAYFFLEQQVAKKDQLRAIWETSASWQDDVNDWGLCDALAKLNTKALEAYPQDVYPELARWNKSENPWKRRQSVVSLLYFYRTKKSYLPFDKIAALVTPLLPDKEYYVQKGVGWTLREMHSVYPELTFEYDQKHIRSISPIAFTIAIEKMTAAEKDSLKSIRKA